MRTSVFASLMIFVSPVDFDLSSAELFSDRSWRAGLRITETIGLFVASIPGDLLSVDADQCVVAAPLPPVFSIQENISSTSALSVEISW